MWCQSEIDQVRLTAAIFTKTEQHIASFQVTMDVCALVNVFVHIKLEHFSEKNAHQLLNAVAANDILFV